MAIFAFIEVACLIMAPNIRFYFIYLKYSSQSVLWVSVTCACNFEKSFDLCFVLYE